MGRTGAIAVLLFVACGAFSQESTLTVPHLTQWVTDLTGTLSSSETAAIERDCRAFTDSTSTQIVVVMIPTLGDQSIEEFSHEVARRNGIGQKGKDNGALLLIVRNDRRIRIEVGYGLEGVLTDLLSDQIIRKEITPYFREGHYAMGIAAGVHAIMAATRHEYAADNKGSSGRHNGGGGSIVPFLVIIFLIIINRLGRRRRRFFGGFPMGGGFPRGGGWGGGGGFGGGGFGGGGGSFGGGGASGRW